MPDHVRHDGTSTLIPDMDMNHYLAKTATSFGEDPEMNARQGRFGLSVSIWLVCLFSGFLWGCTFVAEKPPEYCSPYGDKEPGIFKGLTPAQDYAAEVLAYMLQVVVGQAGARENRAAWRTAGVDIELDFRTISSLLADPGYKKSNLFVLDANILGLSGVLYRYNPRLNQFKGRYVFDSLYPSAELLAVRLLILKKLREGETARFSALLERESLLCWDAPPPRSEDLAAINLTPEEFRLLKDVFTSETIFFHYYKHPFIVEALTRIGFYRREPLTEEVIEKASYVKYARKAPFIPWKRKLTVAIVPSLTGEFNIDGQPNGPYVFGFTPTSHILETIETLKTKILMGTAERVRVKLQKQGAANAADDIFWEMLWERRFLPLVEFEVYDQRPFSIYPEIENQIMDELCPDSDLAVVLLGKDVYRSIHFDADRQDHNNPSQVYIDIEDIRSLYADEKIEAITRFIAAQLVTMAPIARGAPAPPDMSFYSKSAETRGKEGPTLSQQAEGSPL